jgi:ATP-dependent DNA helicase RecG
MFLREIETSVKTLHRVGENSAADLSALGIHSIADLLLFPPRTYEDRIKRVPLGEAARTPVSPTTVNTQAEVLEHRYFGRPGKRTLKVIIQDDTGCGALVCFGRNFLAKKLTPGSRFFIYGVFQHRYGEVQSSSFEVEPVRENGETSGMFGKILPVYPLSGRLTQKLLRHAVSQALTRYGSYLENELPASMIERLDLMEKSSALKEVHFPSSMEQLERARFTLKFEELFYLQLSLLEKIRERKDRSRKVGGPAATRLLESALARLPFPLTRDQQTVLEELRADFSKPHGMTRLLQGDAGCGKTLVSLLTALHYIEAGVQVAMMAPTELLAAQHAETASALTSPLGVRTAVLTGSVKGEQRQLLLSSLNRGEVDLVVGTHALFSQDVRYKNLGFVIVDEQHRFGVLQRLALIEKGAGGKDAPDLLLMTATPIPRTLSLTVFGDLDISTIRMMPPGRKPVKTHLAKQGREEEVYERVRREVGRGRRAYFVYPAIEESGKIDVASAEDRFLYLQKSVFPDYRLGLIHSRLDEEQKKEVMEQFSAGTIDILVSTTVVEVGVDVPEATCMVIENAERFGLSTLHQLRGRVGRGEHQSYAFFIYHPALTDAAKQRLHVLKKTNDGFIIAEEDLRIRGPGEVTGIKQSGSFSLFFSDLMEDYELAKTAREEAKRIAGTEAEKNTVIAKVLQRCPPFYVRSIAGG